jgi:predicted DNA-binding transcriptional regulator YafY
MTEDADGSVTVKFRAGGSLEMAWHLYQWGEHVEVLEPKQLADMVHPNRMPWPGNP